MKLNVRKMFNVFNPCKHHWKHIRNNLYTCLDCDILVEGNKRTNRYACEFSSNGLSFCIIDRVTNDISGYRLPEKFSLSNMVHVIS